MGGKIKTFTEDDIERITGNYSTQIGEGGFGQVYKGVIDDDYDLVPVAVKRFIRQTLRKEFMEELKIHSQMSHKNVVRLIGHCTGKSDSDLMPVTEYISKGNLDDALHSSDILIPLDVRLGIAIGCAEALCYMHSMHLSSHNNLVCHGDIKPANILLDDNFIAKLSDFGLSRLLSGGISRVTSKVIGSMDYMDPVYVHDGRLTPRSDVYSFGIVLLELVARKRVKQGDFYLIRTFADAKGEALRGLFDEAIAKNKNSVHTLHEMVKLANECLKLDRSKRPQMKDVVRRLLVLRIASTSRHENAHWQSILKTHLAWHRDNNQQADKVKLKKSFSARRYFNRNASGSKSTIPPELKNVRCFTNEELNEVTEDFKYPVKMAGSTGSMFYKGTLEDNRVVVVMKFLYADSQEASVNGGILLSQIAHDNVIQLMGYSLLEARTLLVLIYGWSASSKGTLSDILCRHEDFPLDKRLGIAIKTAEALQHLHSSASGVVGHGSVATSSVLADSNFMPKLTDFSEARKLITTTLTKGTGHGTDTSSLLEKLLNSNPLLYRSVLLNLERDVYRFGGVFLALISGKSDAGVDELVAEFTGAYHRQRSEDDDDDGNSRRAIFDDGIASVGAAEEADITALEEIGRLALRCTTLSADEMATRPTMKGVALQLRKIRRCWKKGGAAKASEAEDGAALMLMQAAEPRIPNLMRHLYGYRRISVEDPIHMH